MCWVTLDRALRAAARHGRTPLPDWEPTAAAIREEVLREGWDETAASYTVAYDSPDLDAAVLHIGLSGLLDVSDQRFLDTVTAVERELRVGPTVFRYRYDDGLPGLEGGFHICTTWLIEAYVAVGRIDEAWDLFDQLVNLFGPTGLLPGGIRSGHRNAPRQPSPGLLTPGLHPLRATAGRTGQGLGPKKTHRPTRRPRRRRRRPVCCCSRAGPPGRAQRPQRGPRRSSRSTRRTERREPARPGRARAREQRQVPVPPERPEPRPPPSNLPPAGVPVGSSGRARWGNQPEPVPSHRAPPGLPRGSSWTSRRSGGPRTRSGRTCWAEARWRRRRRFSAGSRGRPPPGGSADRWRRRCAVPALSCWAPFCQASLRATTWSICTAVLVLLPRRKLIMAAV